MAASKDDGRKRIAENRKARHEYRLGDTYEAGIALTGTEVKSLRVGQANIAESYASAEKGGIFLINAYIPEYKSAGNFFQHNPRRPRRLLLHKNEIHKLSIAVDRQHRDGGHGRRRGDRGQPRRPRRLLLHKKEMHKIAIAVDRQGMTMVPLELYFNARGRAKLRLALAQGKKLHDKRADEAKRDWQRQKARLLRDKG